MAYNDISGDYYISQIKKIEDVPFSIMNLALTYRDKLNEISNPEQRRVVKYVVDNFLVEGAETVNLSGGDGTAIGGSAGSAATTGSVVGTADMSGGYDWGTTPEVLMINSISVNLDTLTTDLATTVAEVNDALSVAGITSIQAVENGSNVELQATSAGAVQLVVGDSAGATTLGLTSGTYTGSDEVPASPATATEFAPNFGNVGIAESYFVVTVDGSVTSSTVTSVSPLRIRVSGDVTSATTISVAATNPLTRSEYFRPCLIDPADYINEGVINV